MCRCRGSRYRFEPPDQSMSWVDMPEGRSTKVRPWESVSHVLLEAAVSITRALPTTIGPLTKILRMIPERPGNNILSPRTRQSCLCCKGPESQATKSEVLLIYDIYATNQQHTKRATTKIGQNESPKKKRKEKRQKKKNVNPRAGESQTYAWKNVSTILSRTVTASFSWVVSEYYGSKMWIDHPKHHTAT